MEMHGLAVTLGYRQRDGLTGEPFTQDGWSRTNRSPRQRRWR